MTLPAFFLISSESYSWAWTSAGLSVSSRFLAFRCSAGSVLLKLPVATHSAQYSYIVVLAGVLEVVGHLVSAA